MDDAKRLLWLAYMFCENHAQIEYTIRRGCLCMSCYVYMITWSDEDDKEVYAQGETLTEMIEEGFKMDPGWAK